MRFLALLFATFAFAASAQRNDRPVCRSDRSDRACLGRRGGFEQAPARSECGLPDGRFFPSYAGRCIVTVNSAGTAEVMQCFDATGAEITTTQGASPAFECAWTSPGASDCVRAQTRISSTSRTTVAAANMTAWLGAPYWNNAHTMYVVYNTQSTNAYVLGHGSISLRGMLMRATGTTVECRYSKNGTVTSAAVNTIGTTVASKWFVSSCSRSGTTITARTNGAEGANTLDVVDDANDIMEIGSSGAFPTNGAVATVYFFTAAHSSTDKERFEKQVQCAYGNAPSGLVAISDARTHAATDTLAAEPENLFRYSDNLDNVSAWANNFWSSCAINASQTGPDGGSNAFQVVDTDGAGNCSKLQSIVNVSAGEQVTLQGWVKTDGPDARIRLSAAGVASCNGATVSTPGVWTFTTCTGTAAASGSSIAIFETNTPAQTGNAYFSTLRLCKGAGPCSTVRTYNDARPGGAFLMMAGDNSRWAHSTKGLPSFGSHANLVLRSEEFDNASWTKTRATAAAAAAIQAPDRSFNAEKLAEDATVTNTHFTAQLVTKAASAIAYRWAVYAKAAERTSITLLVFNGAGTARSEVTFNLTTGVASGAANSGAFAGAAGSSVALGGGWYRTLLTFTSDTDTGLQPSIYLNNGAGTTYTGDGTSGVYIWGAHLVATVAGIETPYCTTTTASVVCANDKHLIPAPVGPTVNEGCVRICVNPSWSGASPHGTQYHLSMNSTDNARVYTNGSDTMRMGNGTTITAVAADFALGVTKCYAFDWSVGGNFMRSTNLTSGATNSVAFSGFPSFDANFGYGNNTTGSLSGYAHYSGLKFGAGPGQCL